ncbi:MAG: hypothetical protein DRG78_07465 [Epsilonproteobacteria bacterium]|nr:MAG: hypothetical protein DRG78_07465 [Campylobacterota bacterium]
MTSIELKDLNTLIVPGEYDIDGAINVPLEVLHGKCTVLVKGTYIKQVVTSEDITRSDYSRESNNGGISFSEWFNINSGSYNAQQLINLASNIKVVNLKSQSTNKALRAIKESIKDINNKKIPMEYNDTIIKKDIDNLDIELNDVKDIVNDVKISIKAINNTISEKSNQKDISSIQKSIIILEDNFNKVNDLNVNKFTIEINNIKEKLLSLALEIEKNIYTLTNDQNIQKEYVDNNTHSVKKVLREISKIFERLDILESVDLIPLIVKNTKRIDELKSSIESVSIRSKNSIKVLDEKLSTQMDQTVESYDKIIDKNKNIIIANGISSKKYSDDLFRDIKNLLDIAFKSIGTELSFNEQELIGEWNLSELTANVYKELNKIDNLNNYVFDIESQLEDIIKQFDESTSDVNASISEFKIDSQITESRLNTITNNIKVIKNTLNENLNKLRGTTDTKIHNIEQSFSSLEELISSQIDKFKLDTLTTIDNVQSELKSSITTSVQQLSNAIDKSGFRSDAKISDLEEIIETHKKEVNDNLYNTSVQKNLDMTRIGKIQESFEQQLDILNITTTERIDTEILRLDDINSSSEKTHESMTNAIDNLKSLVRDNMKSNLQMFEQYKSELELESAARIASIIDEGKVRDSEIQKRIMHETDIIERLEKLEKEQ